MNLQWALPRSLLLLLSLLLLTSCSDPVIPLAELPPEPSPLESQPPAVTSNDMNLPTQEMEPGLTDTSIRIAVIADGPNEYLNDSEGLSVRSEEHTSELQSQD